MTTSWGYRQRSSLVRGRARAQLAAIRSERLNRKRQQETLASADVELPACEPVAIFDPSAEVFVAMSENPVDVGMDTGKVADSSQTHVQASWETSGRIESSQPCVDAGVSEDSGRVDALQSCGEMPAEASAGRGNERSDADKNEYEPDGVVARPTGECDRTDAADEALAETAPAPVGPEHVQEPAACHAVPDTETDLFELPGAAPGLVWLLRSADIHSLADLARADAAVLSGKLGAISGILDLGYWIDWARSRPPHD